MKIEPRVPKRIQTYISNHQFSEEPTLYTFPKVVADNLARIDDLPVKTFLAHKATTSQDLIHAAYSAGASIDVSTEGELTSTLNAGVDPDNIEATGPKNNAFIHTLCEKNITVSVDSIAELQRICSTEQQVSVLLRIANPVDSFITRSKFGIRRQDIHHAKTITEGTNVTVNGFHYHGDGLTSRMRAQILSFFLESIHTYFPKASIINIGGGFKEQRLKNPTDWASYIQHLVEDLKEGQNHTWSTTPYGISITKQGTVKGRSSAMHASYGKTLREQLLELLEQEVYQDTTVQSILEETDIELWIEPGYSLLYNTAIASFPVLHTKETPQGLLTVVDGHTFMISTHMSEPYADPLLISESDEPCSTFIGGLLCRNDDVFMTRPVQFDRTPRQGDHLVFCNQGAYATYENATPQQHPQIQHEVIQ